MFFRHFHFAILAILATYQITLRYSLTQAFDLLLQYTTICVPVDPEDDEGSRLSACLGNNNASLLPRQQSDFVTLSDRLACIAAWAFFLDLASAMWYAFDTPVSGFACIFLQMFPSDSVICF